MLVKLYIEVAIRPKQNQVFFQHADGGLAMTTAHDHNQKSRF